MNYTTLEYFFYGKLGRDDFKKLPPSADRVVAVFTVPANFLTFGMLIMVGLMSRPLYQINPLLLWYIIPAYGAILGILWIILYRHLEQEKTSARKTP